MTRQRPSPPRASSRSSPTCASRRSRTSKRTPAEGGRSGAPSPFFYLRQSRKVGASTLTRGAREGRQPDRPIPHRLDRGTGPLREHGGGVPAGSGQAAGVPEDRGARG